MVGIRHEGGFHAVMKITPFIQEVLSGEFKQMVPKDQYGVLSPINDIAI